MEKKKIICNSCERECTVVEESESCTISYCPYCSEEDIYVVEVFDDDISFEEI